MGKCNFIKSDIIMLQDIRTSNFSSSSITDYSIAAVYSFSPRKNSLDVDGFEYGNLHSITIYSLYL